MANRASTSSDAQSREADDAFTTELLSYSLERLNKARRRERALRNFSRVRCSGARAATRGRRPRAASDAGAGRAAVRRVHQRRGVHRGCSLGGGWHPGAFGRAAAGASPFPRVPFFAARTPWLSASCHSPRAGFASPCERLLQLFGGCRAHRSLPRAEQAATAAARVRARVNAACVACVEGCLTLGVLRGVLSARCWTCWRLARCWTRACATVRTTRRWSWRRSAASWL